jgi:hypothetical protein
VVGIGRERRKEIRRHISEGKLDELRRDAGYKHRIRCLRFVKIFYQSDTIAEAADWEARLAATGGRWANAWSKGGLEELMPSFGGVRPPELTKTNKKSSSSPSKKVSRGNHRRSSTF